MVKKIILKLINFYQRTLSPDHGLLKLFVPGGVCRFYPTCSQYAKEAVEKRGVLGGLRLALWRVARCHPWSKGGYDPVGVVND